MVKFRNVALVIGINYYTDLRIADLTTARFDAKKLANVLDEDYNYEVTLLTDENQLATFAGIEQALEQLADRVKPRDAVEKVRLVFYFAGHGMPSQGEDGQAGALVAQDAELEQRKNFLPMKDLYDSLTALDCHHVLIILDCCFAGAFKFNTRDLGFEYTPEEITKERYQRYEGSAAWQVIASAAYDQKALDITLDNRGVKRSGNDPQKATWQEDSEPNSPFAAALFRTLDKTLDQNNTHTPADYTKDGITTATELFVFLDNEVYEGIKKTNHQQVPQFWSLQKKHDKGEFFFETGEFDFAKLPDTPELSQENNPYRGLESFDEAQQRFFFGRQELVKELQGYVERNGHPFTVVLGVSGSGKSSLVKAGLVPQLRELQANWQILTPMRPGLSPLKALAKVMLALEQEVYPNEFQQLEGLTAKLKEARKRSPHDKALTQLLTSWRRSDPDGKLWLIVKNFELWQQLCDDDRPMLEHWRQVGLRRSDLVLEHLEDLKAQSNSGERQALELFYQRCTTQIEDWSENWRNNPEHLGKLIAQWGEKNPAHKLLLVIDQFEELITLASENERESFLVALRAILQAFPQQLGVVATLRVDFEARFLNMEYLKDFWQLENRFLVRPMRRDEFRQVIEGPAQDYVLAFGVNDRNYSLVDQLIDEVELMPGGLPLLSFTLSELYREYVRSHRTDRTLSWDDYKKLHGVSGALTGRATAEYQSLNEQHQATMQRVMLRMVTIEGGGVARRRVSESELKYSSPEHDDRRDEDDRVTTVIERLVNARLLVKGQETGEPYVEPAHDFLVRGWDKLQEWIKEEQENLTLQQRLTPAASDWHKNQRDTEYLWIRDPRLVLLEKVLESETNNWLNQLEVEFVETSKQKRLDELEETKQQLRISEDRRIRAELRDKARRVEDLLPIRSLSSLVLAIEAVGQNLNELPEEIFSSVLSSFNRAMEASRSKNELISWFGFGNPSFGNVDTSVIISEDGKNILSTHNFPSNTSVFLWNEQGSTLDGDRVNRERNSIRSSAHIAISPDGSIIASISQDGNVQLWRNNKGQLTESFSLEQQHPIKKIAFSTKEQGIISINSCGEIHLWSLSGKLIRELFQIPKNAIDSVNLSWDGQNIVSVSDNKFVRLWNAQGNSVGKEFQLPDNTLSSTIIISSDIPLVASVTQTGVLQFWDAQGNLLGQSSEHKDGIRAIAFSPDGKKVAGGVSEIIKIWDLKGNSLEPGFRHQGIVTSISFSPDGQTLFSGARERIARVWDLQSISVGEPFEHQAPISFVTISPDSQEIISIDQNGIVQVWNFDGEPVAQPSQSNIFNSSIGISPNGQLVSAHLIDGVLHFVNLQGELVKKLFAFPRDEENILSPTVEPYRVAWSRNGKIFATAESTLDMGSITHYNSIRFWNADGRTLGEFPLGGGFITTISFSLDGQTVAVCTSGEDANSRADFGAFTDPKLVRNGTIALFDLQEFQLKKSFLAHEGSINSVALSSDGQTIASAGTDGTIRLWNSRGEQISPPLLGHNGSVNSIAFSADGKYVVSAGQDGTLRLWHGDWKSWLKVVCDRLRYHPVFKGYDRPGPREVNAEAAKGACEICSNYVWNPNAGAEKLIKRGITKFEEKDFHASIDIFSLAVQFNAQHPDAHYYRGCAYVKLGHRQKAKADFQKAANLYQEQRQNEKYQNTTNLLEQLHLHAEEG